MTTPDRQVTDLQIIAAAVDVITSVSRQLLQRNTRKLIKGQHLASTVVDPYALVALAQVIEAHYPGVIERSR